MDGFIAVAGHTAIVGASKVWAHTPIILNSYIIIMNTYCDLRGRIRGTARAIMPIFCEVVPYNISSSRKIIPATMVLAQNDRMAAWLGTQTHGIAKKLGIDADINSISLPHCFASE